jgi:hypothetical protein
MIMTAKADGRVLLRADMPCFLFALLLLLQHADEVAIVHGVLKVSNKCVADAMVHMVCNHTVYSYSFYHKFVTLHDSSSTGMCF